MEAAMNEALHEQGRDGARHHHPVARALIGLNRVLMQGVGAAAAGLVVAETLVLLTGVIYRYALHDPLIWSDELASILFIWLSMLGAVLALDRGEHMRLTAIVGKLSDK